uniref:Uncharacterized protein n=2 Tax=Salarias fasciatus TaxID=181472 RepID=A0A672IM26_SALFA
SPATVGLYSSCPNRSGMILKRMEECMNQEASRIEQECEQRPRTSSSFTGFFAVMGRLLFSRPVWTEQNQQYRNVRFIYVQFSAWHFAGSDLLWAGIAVRLFQAMQINFGKLQLALYREAQYEEEDEVKKKIVNNGPNSWRSKKLCCCPLWLLFLCILVIPVIVVTVVLICGPPKAVVPPTQEMNATSDHLSLVEGFLIASIGLPAVSALRFVFLICKDLIFSQELNLKRGMDNQRISGQLGFMNEVRKEMWLLSRFIQFMEVFEKRRIRVVLQITNLDRCSPRKITGVLEAINILLSDEESPFISILAVNPHVLVEKVNFADGCFSREDRAYALLNRIVTLAFTVPPLCDESKCSLFHSLTNNTRNPEECPKREVRHRKRTSSSHLPLVELALHRSESDPPNDEVTAALDGTQGEADSLIWSVLRSNEKMLHRYMLGDSMSMRRVINSVRVTVIIMKALKMELPPPEHIAAWVVLANQWPCRLSWIIQCVEDAQQREEIDGENAASDNRSKTLWKVFSESKAELHVMSAQIEDLLEQDGDPEIFERFLRVDFQFTVGDLQASEVTAVNLDHSIKKELAQIRGISKLGDSAWMRRLAPLPISTVINMKTEDVCNELEKMDYPSKYMDIVKSNDLNGLALVFGDTQDLKALLDMNFGQWATFRLHFLSSPSHLRQPHRNMTPAPPHPKSQLSSFVLHAPHRSSSNLSLVNS